MTIPAKGKMGKKRKTDRSSGTGPKLQLNQEEMATGVRFDQDEIFEDSQDEFFAGKDQILLEEGPSRKKRKKIREEGD